MNLICDALALILGLNCFMCPLAKSWQRSDIGQAKVEGYHATLPLLFRMVGPKWARLRITFPPPAPDRVDVIVQAGIRVQLEDEKICAVVVIVIETAPECS